MSTRLFPIFARLEGRRVVVVGGGAVAARKVAAVRESGGVVTVVAPQIGDDLRSLVDRGDIRWVDNPFEDSHLDGAWLVIAATSDARVNRHVADAAQSRRVWANVVDDAELSLFHVPAVVDRSPVLVAISSGGQAPMLSRLLREQLETLLEPHLGALARLVGGLRQRIRVALPDPVARRRYFDVLLRGTPSRLLRRGQHALAQAEAERLLERMPAAPVGSVVLVGAGAGDAGLLTLRGLRALNEADVILHDRLVSPDVLAMARRDALFVEVGKQAGHHHASQEHIHGLMLEHARAGRRVVRLKGGDPFVFGRGGEELQFLRAHGVPYEVVPGVTAALACAAHAGIPLTHRGLAQSVRLLTAHCQGDQDRTDWASLAGERQTLAIYMGVAEAARLQAELIAHGRSPETPVAWIENGGRPGQRVIVGTLGQVAERGEAWRVRSPALLVVGEVAALARELWWYGEPPVGEASGPHVIHAPRRPQERFDEAHRA